MKKAKELLWFLIPFFAVMLATLVYALVKSISYGIRFTGPVRYALLFLSDKNLSIAFINTYLLNIGCALIGFGIFAVFCKAISKKRNVSRKFFYIAGILVASAFNFLMLLISISDGLRGSETYPAHTIVEAAPPSVWQMIDGFNVISSVKFGTIAVFLVWLIETIIGAIKRKNKVIE